MLKETTMKKWLLAILLLGMLAAWPATQAEAHPRRCGVRYGYRSYGYAPYRSYSYRNYGPRYSSYYVPRFNYGVPGYGYGYGGYRRGISVYFGGW